MYFDRNATQSAAKRRGSGGMDRRSNAAWVLPQAVKTRFRRDGSPLEQPFDLNMRMALESVCREDTVFVREKTSGKHTYLQIVESHRRDGKPRQSVIASLGRVETLLARLLTACGGTAREHRDVERAVVLHRR